MNLAVPVVRFVEKFFAIRGGSVWELSPDHSHIPAPGR